VQLQPRTAAAAQNTAAARACRRSETFVSIDFFASSVLFCVH